MKLPSRAVTVLLIIAAFTAAPAFSENRWGIFGGADMNRLTGDDWKKDLDSADYKNGGFGGANLGFFLSFDFSESLAFRPGIRVIDVGGRGSNDLSTLRIETKLLHLPLLVSYSYPLGSGKVYGVAGPSVNILLRSIEEDFSSPSGNSSFENDDYNALVLGGILGVGYEVSVAKALVSLEIRYHATLTEVIRDSDIYFNTASALLGLAFPIP